MNTNELKTRLVDYLRAEGVEIKNGVKKPKIDCFAHAESNASMTVNVDEGYVYCHGCEFGGDVFKVAGRMHNLTDFPDQLKKVADVLGVVVDTNTYKGTSDNTVKAPKSRKKKEPRFVAVPEEEAKEIYTRKYFQELADRYKWGEFNTGWLYRNANSDVDLVDVRFDKDDGDKNVISFWYDGKSVQSKNPPVLLYNRDQLEKHKDAPVLIVEGCKAAHAASKLKKFVAVTWNGGTGRVKNAQWRILKTRDVYIYPDDDQKTKPRTSELLPEHEQLGIKAALYIKEKRLPRAKIIEPPEKAREVKASGADVVEALEVMTPEELTEYIFNCDHEVYYKCIIGGQIDYNTEEPDEECTEHNTEEPDEELTEHIPVDDRPVITISDERGLIEQHLVTTGAINSLSRADNVFQRDGHLVRCVRVGEKEGRQHAPVNSLIIRKMNPATIGDVLTETAQWKKYDKRKGGTFDANPSKDVVFAVSERGEYPPIYTLEGISEVPIVRPDGTIVEERGYDRVTGYYYEPQIDFPAVPENPTQDDAREALAMLNKVFDDFPIDTEQPEGRFVPIAAILSILGRPLIKGDIPLFMIDASTASTGKTYLCDTMSIIATGRPAPKITWPGLRQPEELEKILASVALDAPPLICFDNVATPLGGTALDKYLTCNSIVQIRILGKTISLKLPWHTLIFANGNNIQVEGDTVTRVLSCRMESLLEHPEKRDDFEHPDLLAWVKEERARIVVAALTILRAWIVAGRPHFECAGLTRFPQWSKSIPAVIVFAGGKDPTVTCDSIVESSGDERAAILNLLDLIDNNFFSDVTARKVYEKSKINNELRDTLSELIFSKKDEITSRKIGALFKKIKGRVIGGRRLVSRGKSDNSRIWIVLKSHSAKSMPEQDNSPEQDNYPEQVKFDY